MEKLLKEIRFSLVHVHPPVAAYVARLSWQRINTHPMLYTVHGFHFYKGAPLKKLPTLLQYAETGCTSGLIN